MKKKLLFTLVLILIATVPGISYSEINAGEVYNFQQGIEADTTDKDVLSKQLVEYVSFNVTFDREPRSGALLWFGRDSNANDEYIFVGSTGTTTLSFHRNAEKYPVGSIFYYRYTAGGETIRGSVIVTAGWGAEFHIANIWIG